MSPKDSRNPAADGAQDSTDGALRLLRKRALMDGTTCVRHFVPLLEIFGIGRTIGNGSQAQLTSFGGT